MSVSVNIGKHPKNVKQDENGYYYTDDSGGRVNLTDEWYPDPEGTYRKLTHTPESNAKISAIVCSGSQQNGFEEASLPDCGLISVYYWSLDNTCSKPLLIQLGSGNTYYITEGGDGWKNQSDINDTNLRKKLNKQNCKRNQAHTIDLSNKGNTTYSCPSCRASIRVYNSGSYGGITSYGHAITSISGFKDNTDDQIGLPSLKDVSSVTVFWSKSGGIPLLIAHQNGWHNWYRRNSDTVNTWSEVSQYDRPTGPSDEDGNMQKLLQRNYYYPSIIIDLSRPTNATYSDKGTGIDITVRSTSVYGGYHMFEHSLRGGLFKLNGVQHTEQTNLNGITSDGELGRKLESITACYYGDHPSEEKRLLLVELVVSERETKYKYYYRTTKGADSWTKLDRSEGETTRLKDNSLKEELERLKKEHFPDTPDPSPVAPSQSSEAKDYSSVPEKSTSPVGPLVGGTVCALVTLVAMVLLVKFWPKVRTRFVGIWNGFGIHKKGELNM
ncbi:hypothetical protein BEWA_027470 [Theileria equi strain WA]|uniref:Uncharacterized protein n=1 Tax=Theileria equi strain WA TaxID=1537102 RepID=L0AXE4_THEEQ|nr:hypothetical protein BEWA_027470 [Theileria equi strain WA]AFZ79898.1 hypothetical protein BEWA_027470 [Theileria equi strain WA]|eukprot:XP_004829564.1 hypothetical protein BEWA_027470 [Theileria equi strain WA]